nr:R-linalool synthase QH1, chloroplastic-like [Tanacetum cinerariifolium]
SKVENPLSMLEMIDDLQRLGIAYHFQDEIRDSLKMIYYNYYETQNKWDKMDLNLKALGFRLLRQHGYQVPQGNRSEICKPIYSSQSTSMALISKVEPPVRRSANYVPSLWSFDHIQSLSSKYTGEDYTTRANTLKNDVKMMISKVENPLSMLEMIDDLQRLGIAYHFQDEIRDSLKMIYYNYYETQNKWDKMDLNLKALGFRLLRQHGYQVPQ